MPDPDWLIQARKEGGVVEQTVNVEVLNAAKSARAIIPSALPGMEPSEPGDKFEAELPWPISVNHYYTRWVFEVPGKKPSIRAAVSKDGQDFINEVRLRVGRVKPMSGPLMFTLVLHEPNKMKHDIDNYNKGLFDALKHAGIYHDDSQIRMLITTYGPLCRPKGKVVVRIVPLGEML